MSFAVKRPVIALIIWFLIAAGVVVASGGKAQYNDSLTIPGVESTTAIELLTKIQGSAATPATAKIVWSPSSGAANDQASKRAITPTLEAIAALPFVSCVSTPFGTVIGKKCGPAIPTDLKAAVAQAIAAALEKKTGASAAQLKEGAKILAELGPLAKADPAQLGAIGRALPAVAQLASAPKSTLDALAALTPKQLDFLVGLTGDDITTATTALGYLDQLAALPPATLAALAKANPAQLAAVAAALPKDVGQLEAIMSALKKAIAKDPALGKEIEALAAKYGITVAQLQQFVAFVNDIAPIATSDPATLAEVARALPSLAKFASTDKATIDALAKLTPEDLKPLIGLTTQDINNIVLAFGAIDKVAQLPPDVLAALAQADPAKLAAFGKALPADVAAAEKVMAEVKAEIGALEDAAAAAQVSIGQISPNGEVAVAAVTFTSTAPTPAQGAEVVALIEKARTPTFSVGGSGGVLDGASTGGPDVSGLIGLGVAFVVLLIAFASLVAAGLPLVVAITGLVVGLFAGFIASHYTTIPSVSQALVAMIGLGVGIDYSLFILARYNQGLRGGLEPKQAVLTSVRTAGRAVIFAGTTVIVALLGMFVFRIDMFNGLAIAAALGVLFVMASATVMLPALLSLLGRKAFAIHLPWGGRIDGAGRHTPGTQIEANPELSRWARYGALLQKAPWIPAILCILAVGALAMPAREMRLGFPDDGSAPAGSVTRVGYDLLTQGFGPGVNGPFVVVLETKTPNDFDSLAKTIAALEATPGVNSTTPSSAMLPLIKLNDKTFTGNLTAIEVLPTTSPQDQATDDTLQRIRGETKAKVVSETGASIYVGGALATNDDFTDVLKKSLPLFLAFVIGLAMIALIMLFRSLVIPITAALTALLSFAGALGVTVAVFQNGVANSLLGVSGTGPILPFLPVMLFAVLFGLSMDYQVFLVTRMKEEWEAAHDNAQAVRFGLAGSGRVVVVAATIMTSVFLGFVFTDSLAVKTFGVAFAAAVIIDAFIVRLVLVPSVMSIMGKSNWWLPNWLAKILPNISLE